MHAFPDRTSVRTNRVWLAAAVLAATAIAYWPIHAAGLVWDDKFYLHDRAWLRQGRDWLQIVFHGFPDWGAYFRPLGVALFTAEIRLFDTAPMPMHMTSLVLHLLNTLLVGLVARKFFAPPTHDARSKLLVCAAMLLYGLHPALIEPVAWISSQFDLLVTLFTLLGILANLVLSSAIARGAAVAACFFLAACSKESAVSFPLLILIVDWLHPIEVSAPSSTWKLARDRLRRQWFVYLAIFIAGVAYLSFRHAGLGSLIGSNGRAASFSGLQLAPICDAYLAYWKLLIWPMAGLGPLHLMPQGQPMEFAWTSWAAMLTATCLALASLWLLYKRKPLGGLMAGFTAALLPALHIVPIHFDDNLYQERYATTAIAIVCIFLPLVAAEAIRQYKPRPSVIRNFLLGGIVWLVLAAVNVRTTLPLWANEVRLWRWALAQNPTSIVAKDSLLSTYIEQDDIADARPLADALMHDGRTCARCMLDVAFLALMRKDADRASTALMQAKLAMGKSLPRHALAMGYTLASGNLDELRQRPADAEKAYRTAIAMDPLSPEAYMNLALLLAREGELEQARKMEKIALSLSAADARATRRKEFDRVLTPSKTVEMPAR